MTISDEKKAEYQRNRAAVRRARTAADPDFAEKRRSDHREYRKQNPDVGWREDHLRRNYGITVDDYNRLLDAQGCKCAICGRTEAELTNNRIKRLVVDHCHETGEVRGLLCNACNNGLGMFRDQPVFLTIAAEYLERAQARS